jgi:hypothetical protein
MRTISAIVDDVIDNTDVEHLVTIDQADRLKDQIVRALAAEGYEVT